MDSKFSGWTCSDTLSTAGSSSFVGPFRSWSAFASPHVGEPVARQFRTVVQGVQVSYWPGGHRCEHTTTQSPFWSDAQCKLTRHGHLRNSGTPLRGVSFEGSFHTVVSALAERCGHATAYKFSNSLRSIPPDMQTVLARGCCDGTLSALIAHYVQVRSAWRNSTRDPRAERSRSSRCGRPHLYIDKVGRTKTQYRSAG